MLLSFRAFSQAPVSETIHVNSVEAKVWSNGVLFGRGNERSFKIPKSDDNDSVKVAAFRSVVPWIGGYDDFGNLKIACTSPTGTTTDFLPGIIGQDGYNQIWKVTREEIKAHIHDFQDNGVIDNPIPAIMNWPGMLMLHPYNFDTSFVNTEVAPFYDNNYNGIYDPLSGDFPYPELIASQELIQMPDEMLFFAFHDYTPGEHPVTKGKRMTMQIFCTLWAYNCPADTFFNNSIFVNLKYWNRGNDPLDSLYLGFLMNIELGDSNDNFIGSVPDQHIFYAYNGDTLDQGGFEEHTPLLDVFTLQAYDGTTNIMYEANEFFMPVRDPGSNIPAGNAYPHISHDFYRNLIGYWRDGTPLREGGNGYHPNDNLPAVRCAYPGDATDTIGWSEPTANNIPGRRMVLVSVPAIRMNPYTRTSRSFCFNWVRQNGGPNPLKASLEMLQDKRDYLSNLWLGWDSGEEYPECSLSSSTPKLDNNVNLRIWPNPNSGHFHIFAQSKIVTTAILTDPSGKTLYQQHNLHTSELNLDLPLPAGLYFLTVITDDNKRLMQKLVISH